MSLFRPRANAGTLGLVRAGMGGVAARLQGFIDRSAAGVQLAAAIRRLKPRPPLSVLGLPRGGVTVAFEVARILKAPLDVLVVRKIGMPGQREFAIGAIAWGGIVMRDPAAARFGPDERAFEELVRHERHELERREHLYRGGLPSLDLHGTTAVLVDDGLATGSTMLAAVRAARHAGATRVIAAAPVASEEASARVAEEADQLAILLTPPFLQSVGEWYEDFTQVEDDEVRELLRRARSGELLRDTQPAD